MDGVEAFLRVAQHRSFSAAAADLGLSPSAVSQSIRALEQRIGAPLFTRTTRSVGLTQAGEQFLERAEPAYAGLGEAFEAARTLGETPAGRLRINLPRATIAHIFPPIIEGFCAAYPLIELDICAEDRLIDLAAGGFDAGVRLGESLAADMIAVRLTGPLRFIVVGTPGYFRRHPRPAHPADLSAHRCIRFRMPGGGMMGWNFVDGPRSFDVAVSGPVIVNDHMTQMLTVETGVGLAYVAEPSVRDAIAAGRLEPVLEQYAHASDGVFLYYPSRSQMLPKLRVFIDYLRRHLIPKAAGE